VAFHDVDNDLRCINLADDDPASRPENIAAKAKSVVAKIRRQAVKDYVAFPLLSLPFGPAGVAASAGGAAVANIVRNVWAFTVIFCGHFPDGTHFTDAADAENETDGEWYLRQIQGSANFEVVRCSTYWQPLPSDRTPPLSGRAVEQYCRSPRPRDATGTASTTTPARSPRSWSGGAPGASPLAAALTHCPRPTDRRTARAGRTRQRPAPVAPAAPAQAVGRRPVTPTAACPRRPRASPR
jgi:hypothetical protein